MSCILILENLRSPNSTVLVHFCRVLKIKHTANRIFAVCFIEATAKETVGQTVSLAAIFAVCPTFAVGRFAWRTANLCFVVCYNFVVCLFS